MKKLKIVDKEIFDISKQKEIIIKEYLVKSNVELLENTKKFFIEKKWYNLEYLKNKKLIGGKFKDLKKFKSNKPVYLRDISNYSDYFFEFQNMKDMYEVIGETYWTGDIIIIAKDFSFLIGCDEDNSCLYYTGEIQILKN